MSANDITAEQDAAAEAPQVEPAKPAKPRAPRKGTAAAKLAEQAKAEAAAEKRPFRLDGVEYQVAKSLTDSQAMAACVKLRDANKPAEAEVAPEVTAAPKAPRGMKLAAGECKVRLSKTAFEALAGSDGADWRKEHAKRWKSIKGTKASRFGSTVTFYFPVSQDEGKALVAWLKATGKRWDKLDTKERPGNPKPLFRNADLMTETLGAWRKGQ